MVSTRLSGTSEMSTPRVNSRANPSDIPIVPKVTIRAGILAFATRKPFSKPQAVPATTPHSQADEQDARIIAPDGDHGHRGDDSREDKYAVDGQVDPTGQNNERASNRQNQKHGGVRGHVHHVGERGERIRA